MPGQRRQARLVDRDARLVGDLDAHLPSSAGAVARATRSAAGDPLGVPGRRTAGVITLIGVHDVRHELVPDHVVAGQLREVHVLDAVEYLLYQPQAADL